MRRYSETGLRRPRDWLCRLTQPPQHLLATLFTTGFFFGVAEAVGGVSTDGFFADINARWDDCCDDNPEAWSDDPALVRAQMDVAHDWLTAVVDFIASNPAPISTLSTVAA